MAKTNDNYKQVWLHDEDKDFAIIPYTVLDNIKVKSQNNLLDFSENYKSLENKVNTNASSLETLEDKISYFTNILYGDHNPEDEEGSAGDLYIQYKNNQINKIWQKINSTWIPYELEKKSNITIGNTKKDNKPKFTISIKVSNA